MISDHGYGKHAFPEATYPIKPKIRTTDQSENDLILSKSDCVIILHVGDIERGWWE